MALLEKTILEASSEFELRIPMTYEQFLSELGEDVHAEWVNGETVLFMPPKPEHQDIVSFLLVLIKLYVDHFQLGKVLTAPIEMKPTPQSNSREPDILFVANENLHRIGESKLEGPADLVIEVISTESVRRDTVDKRLEYEREGIQEYWIIDKRAGRQDATFYVADSHGQYQRVQTDSDGIYHSTVLTNFWLDTGWLWANPQPAALKMFAQIVGPDELIKALEN